MIRKLAVEFLGTAILVFFAVGVATLMFGFRFAGASVVLWGSFSAPGS
jgi:aquaporin Z